MQNKKAKSFGASFASIGIKNENNKVTKTGKIPDNVGFSGKGGGGVKLDLNTGKYIHMT